MRRSLIRNNGPFMKRNGANASMKISNARKYIFGSLAVAVILAGCNGGWNSPLGPTSGMPNSARVRHAECGGACASTPTLSDGVVSSIGTTGSSAPEQQAYLTVTLYENGDQVAQVTRTCAPFCPGFSDTVSYTCKSKKSSNFYATASSTYGSGKSSTVKLACH